MGTLQQAMNTAQYYKEAVVKITDSRGTVEYYSTPYPSKKFFVSEGYPGEFEIVKSFKDTD